VEDEHKTRGKQPFLEILAHVQTKEKERFEKQES
jgi:hypothetical protein